ncbi:MAG: pyridoxal phosphate-dependent aminotransferase [Deltaproteobacteria bacterium]|nr:pyridoxal phosphate-dependent aminotransferase [Deltaproteobacteria bacterium]
MIKLGQIIQSIKPSATLSASARAQELKAQGRDIISLTVGEPDFDTPDHIKSAAIDAMNKGLTKYTAAGGILPLKKVLVEKFRRDQDTDYAPAQIVVTNGGKQAIAAVMSVLLNSGDEVIIPAPYWTSYPDMVMLAGGNPVIVRTRADEGYLMTAQVLESAISPRTKMIIINSPSNPTGYCYSKAELNALAEVIRRHPQGENIVILSDEVYEYLTYDNIRPLSIAQVAPDLKEQIVIVNAFSKAYSMTGWRVGYLAAPLSIARAVDMYQSQFTSNVCSIAQYAALHAYDDNYAFPKMMLIEFEKRRQIVIDKVANISGLSLPVNPRGAFYAFIRTEGLIGKRNGDIVIKSGTEFSSYLLEKFDIAVVAGEAFGDEHAFRMSFALGTESLIKALHRISQAVTSVN